MSLSHWDWRVSWCCLEGLESRNCLAGLRDMCVRVCVCVCVRVCVPLVVTRIPLDCGFFFSAGGSGRSLGTATNEDAHLIWYLLNF